MNNRNQTLNKKIKNAIFIAIVSIIIIEPIVVKVFFWERTEGRFHDLMFDHPLLLYLMVTLLIGYTAFFMYHQWNLGNKNHASYRLKPYIEGFGIIFIVCYEAVLFCLVFI